ncbi:MAG: hypothetical protein R3343_10005 [Nitriliruptorales bacterium]|nr:hypothetical protein [Nitriliruptorales bacterium]
MTTVFALAFFVSACAGPEDPSAAANNAAPAPPTTTSETQAETGADEDATTADGALDFSAITGSWQGQVQGPGGTHWVVLEIDPSAEAFSSAGTWQQGVTAGEPGCQGKLIAVEAKPPMHRFSLTFPEEESGAGQPCQKGRVWLILDPATETLDFEYKNAYQKWTGTLNTGDTS